MYSLNLSSDSSLKWFLFTFPANVHPFSGYLISCSSNFIFKCHISILNSNIIFPWVDISYEKYWNISYSAKKSAAAKVSAFFLCDNYSILPLNDAYLHMLPYTQKTALIYPASHCDSIKLLPFKHRNKCWRYFKHKINTCLKTLDILLSFNAILFLIFK